MDVSSFDWDIDQNLSGSGDGYGYGYGYGSGYGLSDYFACAIASTHTSKGVVALWRSDSAGMPANGGRLEVPASIGVVHESAGPLSLCHDGTLHATWRPTRWHGDRLWVVALHGDVISGDDKLGALKREILAEIKI